MSNIDDNDDRTRKERSPSYPFISLPKALDRARAFDEAHRRNPTRLAAVAETWGYSSSSSGLLQTASALKAFGLLEDSGRGNDRKIQLTDLAQRILHDTRPGARDAAIKEAALKPRLFAEYADKWLPSRPSDSHCLSELRLDRGFTEGAAGMFLRSFDETVTFAGLRNGDDLSPTLKESQLEHGLYEGSTGPTGPSQASRVTGPTGPPGPHSFRSMIATAPKRFGGGGGGARIDDRQYYGGGPSEPLGSPRATLPLVEGLAALEIPARLSRQSYDALKSWVNLMVQLAERTIIESGEMRGVEAKGNAAGQLDEPATDDPSHVLKIK
jgi:hypothetical protein